MVSDELWARIQPLLPVVPRRVDHPGRKRLDDRKALCGILFVLYTGIPWEFLSQELGFGSGMYGRSREAQNWTEPGRPCPNRLETPSDHRSARYPLAVIVTGGNRHDVTQLIPLIEAIPPVRGRQGPPRSRPDTLYTDRAYDYKSTADWSETKESRPCSLDAESSMGPVWACIDRWASRPSPCCTGSGVYVSAGRSATTSTKPSSGSPAASSAGAASDTSHWLVNCWLDE
jgi:hypothetical protein